MADDPVFNHLPIALVGPLPPPSGGMANQTRQLARLLDESGLHVELVQVNSPYPIWISQVPIIRAVFRLAPYLVQLWRVTRRVRLMHIMANSGWSWYLFVTPAVWIGWLRRVPVVINYRGGEAETFFSRAWRWVRPTVVKADLVVVPSGFLEAIFARRKIKTKIVPNIIDLQHFYPSEVQHDRELHLLVARNLEPIYDIATALKAFALLKKDFPSTKLSVAGSGPLRLELGKLADSLGIAESVTFTGRLDNAQMAELYRSVDLLLNPSLADNMPISLLEALACGVPIVSTNVGGIPCLVEEGQTALLIDPGDAEAMAKAATRILRDPILAASLRVNGLALAQNYAWSKVREQWFSAYAGVLQGKSRKRD
ncbi:MAG: glycosyltransferase family 4 protein [Candidatus Competibacteraceae bacterium]|nr:glycosyltransferase family 4 protein [Candidatus Competibacteraceae bacterium]